MSTDTHMVAVHVPRGPERWWPVILGLDTGGTWTVAHIMTLTGSDRALVQRYVSRLVAGGYAVRQPQAGHHRLARRPVQAPDLDDTGNPRPLSAQQMMWNAIRSLRSFSHLEIAHAASIDTQPISPSAAKDYVNRLGRAGFFNAVSMAKPGTPTTWALKPSMNGPLAPMIMRTKFVWDPNTRAIVGAGDDAREVQS